MWTLLARIALLAEKAVMRSNAKQFPDRDIMIAENMESREEGTP